MLSGLGHFYRILAVSKNRVLEVSKTTAFFQSYTVPTKNDPLSKISSLLSRQRFDFYADTIYGNMNAIFITLNRSQEAIDVIKDFVDQITDACALKKKPKQWTKNKTKQKSLKL